MEARVNSEMLIYLSKTNSWAFYETWIEEYKHWVTATVGLTIQAIPPAYPVVESQHRAVQKSHQNISCCRSVCGAGMRSPRAQHQPGYSGVFILCRVQHQSFSSMEHKHQGHGMKAIRGMGWKPSWTIFWVSNPRFGATGFVLSKYRCEEMCLLSTLESVWSGRGVLSTRIFLVIICGITHGQMKWKLWQSWSRGLQQGDCCLSFKSRELSPSKNHIMGGPVFQDKIFGKWVQTEEILLFTQKLVLLANSVMCCWDR